ncbi:MAG TPA: hypothetical protein VG963_23155 [Polyangiaceae bacterium]|nr:hypothetical protein [Polyangiaceae bacterium]
MLVHREVDPSRATQARARTVQWLGALTLLLSACGRNATLAGTQSPDRASRKALIAQPCPALLGDEDATLDPKNARVFVEVAEVVTPGLPQPLGHWLDGRSVDARSTAHLVAFPNTSTTTPWGQCVDEVCSTAQYSLTLTARLPEHASGAIALSLRIEHARPSDDAAPPAASSAEPPFEIQLAVKNQEHALIPPQPGVSQGSFVVTPYLLRRYDDLHRILQCTAAESTAAAASATGS